MKKKSKKKKSKFLRNQTFLRHLVITLQEQSSSWF